MLCHPQIHPGWSTKFYLRINQQVSDTVLYPIQTLSGLGTRASARFIEEYPCYARVCCLPLALWETLATPIVLLIDLVWAFLGIVVSALLWPCMYCASDITHAPADFMYATIVNLVCLLFNLFFGVMMLFTGCIGLCRTGEWAFMRLVLMCPCVWPLTIVMNVWSLCSSPEKVAGSMSSELDQVLNV